MAEKNKKFETPIKKVKFSEMKKLANTFQAIAVYNPEVYDTKFGRSYLKFEEDNIANVFKEYNKEVKGIEIDNALEDKNTGAILFEDPQRTKYQYSKDGLKNKIKQEEALYEEWKDKEYEVETRYFVGEYPDFMSELQKELFAEYVVAKK